MVTRGEWTPLNLVVLFGLARICHCTVGRVTRKYMFRNMLLNINRVASGGGRKPAGITRECMIKQSDDRERGNYVYPED